MKVAIVGAGKLGFKVTEALLGGDHSVTLIDKNENALSKLISQMDIMTVHANGKEIRVLESLPAQTATKKTLPLRHLQKSSVVPK